MKRLPLLSAPILLPSLLFISVSATAQVTNLSFLSNGLVAHFRLNGNAEDASGFGNDGVAVRTTLTTNRFGRADSALAFDGTNSYVFIPPSLDLSAVSNVLSVSAWINLSRADGGSVYLVSRGKFTFGISYGNLYLPGYTCDSALLIPGRFYHVVATVSNQVSSIYVNGRFRGGTTNFSIPARIEDSLIPFTVGASLTVGGRPQFCFQGVVEDFRIYNRPLSAQEVANLYAFESVAPFAPSLSIQVKTLRVNMLLQPGTRYQLETSPDMRNWSAYGIPFLAISSNMFQDFDVLDGRQYYRLNEVP